MQRILCAAEQRAADYAEVVHGTQLRKYSGDPYVVHTKRVADIVASVPGNTLYQRQAAHLHDTIEDPKVTRYDLECRFGVIVATYVYELSDVATLADGNRAARKAIETARLARIQPDTQTVKLADLYDNSEDILQNDPGFAKTYLPEKAAALAVLTRGDVGLWLRCYDVLEAGMTQLRLALPPELERVAEELRPPRSAARVGR